MNDNIFVKNFLTILVVVVGVTTSRIIINHKTPKDNHNKSTTNILINVEPSTKNKITKKQKLIKNLKKDFLILIKEFEIKNININKYYNLPPGDLNNLEY
ncbi:putative membrane protein [Candidatus Phytoplasma solani]|uniref:hypothetical protein n=1 Tax=Candidatus Phytoplasma solani TaxID=69896 RepID=UPI0032DBB1FA